MAEYVSRHIFYLSILVLIIIHNQLPPRSQTAELLLASGEKSNCKVILSNHFHNDKNSSRDDFHVVYYVF